MNDASTSLSRPDLRVSLIQESTRWHDAAGNRQLYGDSVRAVAGRSDLVILPETFTSGFSNDAIGDAETMQGASVAWLRKLAQECGAVITGSMVIRDDERVYNRLLWARPDGSLSHYDKKHLFRMAGEHTRYAEGGRRCVFELKGWRICPLVCYDLRFPVWSRNRFDGDEDRFEYDVLVYVANWPAARRYAWQTLLRARAIENLAYVAGVNRVGTDGNEIAYAGDSAALDFLGQPLVEVGAQPQTISVTLSADALAQHRQRFPAQLDADRFTLHP